MQELNLTFVKLFRNGDFGLQVSRRSSFPHNLKQNSKEIQTAQLALEEGAHRTFIGTIYLFGREKQEGEIRIDVFMQDGSKYDNIVSYSFSDLRNSMDSLNHSAGI